MTPTAPFILELNIKPSILVFPAALAAFKTLHNRDKSADKHNVVSVKLSSARKHQKLTAQGNSWIITLEVVVTVFSTVFTTGPCSIMAEI